MNAVQPSTAPAPPPTRGKLYRIWQGFWLTFLVGSLAYAWYCFYVPSNEIAWADDYTTAQQQAVEADKPMLLFFTGPWCVPCRIMKRQVFADDEVRATVNASFVPVTIDLDDSKADATVSQFGVGATPSTLITDSKGTVLQWRQGGMSKADFLAWIGELDPSDSGDS